MSINSDQPQQRYKRHRRPRNPPAQSSPHAQSVCEPQSGSVVDATGAVLGSSSNTTVNGGNFTAAANVNHRNLTINISDGVVSQTQTENCDLRETTSRRRYGRKRYSTVPAQRINKVYEKHLESEERGHPLWIPQPNMVLPIPYRAQGVRVGDVGLITERGAFDFLFNVCVAGDDPINPPELPDNFLPISVNPTDIRKYAEFSPGSYLTSSTVSESRTAEQSSGLIFESSASEGAILTMPEGAYSEDLSNCPRFKKYIATHARDWYSFVNGPRGREAQNGDLHVVVGSDKTTSWGMAAFANSTLSEDTNFRLKFSAEQPSHCNGGNSYAWEHSGAKVKVGPDRSENQELGESDSNRLRNQCLFLRSMHVTLSEIDWKEIFPQAVVVTDSHPEIQDQDVTCYPQGSSTACAHGKSSHSQNLPSQSSTGKQTSGQILSDTPPNLSGCEVIQCDSTPTPNVASAAWSSSNDDLHPSKLISRYLLQQNPHAKVAVTHDRDYRNWINMDSNFSKILPVLAVLSRNDIVLDDDTGLIYLEPKEANGILSEAAKFAGLIESIQDGKLTLDQYLFGSHGDHCLRLQYLCTALRPGSTNVPLFKSSSLIGHPKRPLSLDELLKICNGGSTQRQPILKLRAELDSLLSEHADRSSCLLRLADGLSRRFFHSDHKTDLEEAIRYYEEALSLLPNSHYQYLETLLGLCSSIYQRFYLLGHTDDLENLLRYLELERDVLEQLHSILAPVETQLKKHPQDLGSAKNPQFKNVRFAIPNLTYPGRGFDLLDLPLNSIDDCSSDKSNEHVLNVHRDKYPLAKQTENTYTASLPESLSGVVHPPHVTLPPGYMPDVLPTSTPPSPPVYRHLLHDYLNPTDDAIKAIIQQATSAVPQSTTTGGLPRDTRTQLFVGNLPYRVRRQDLKDLFRKAGTILRADVCLGLDNRSRCYGTVLLATAEDAGRAVAIFNGYSWQSKILEVRLDKQLQDFESSSGSSQLSPPPPASESSSVTDDPYPSSLSDPSSSRNLFVANLPSHCQRQDLRELFRQAGTIICADVVLGPDGRSRGFGVVVFATELGAERALKMFNGYEFNGFVLNVHRDKHSLTNQSENTSSSSSGVSHITSPLGYSSDMLDPPHHRHRHLYDWPRQRQQQLPSQYHHRDSKHLQHQRPRFPDTFDLDLSDALPSPPSLQHSSSSTQFHDLPPSSSLSSSPSTTAISMTTKRPISIPERKSSSFSHSLRNTSSDSDRSERFFSRLSSTSSATSINSLVSKSSISRLDSQRSEKLRSWLSSTSPANSINSLVSKSSLSRLDSQDLPDRLASPPLSFVRPHQQHHLVQPSRHSAGDKNSSNAQSIPEGSQPSTVSQPQ